jgi:adenylate cyclase class 2
MPVEIEIKLKVEHLEPVRASLRQLGAKRAGEVLETNTFFDTPDRSLMGSDCGLRLRSSRDVTSGAEKIVLTFKGPRAEGRVKRREEIEVKVDSLAATADLLARLGYARNLSFEKRRETWKLDRATVELDTVPHLGPYVEIEGSSEAEVTRVQAKLGLSHLTPVIASYPDLVSHHLTDARSHAKSLTFL